MLRGGGPPPSPEHRHLKKTNVHGYKLQKRLNFYKKLKKKNAKNNSKPINWAVTLSENTQYICIN